MSSIRASGSPLDPSTRPSTFALAEGTPSLIPRIRADAAFPLAWVIMRQSAFGATAAERRAVRERKNISPSLRASLTSRRTGRDIPSGRLQANQIRGLHARRMVADYRP